MAAWRTAYASVVGTSHAASGAPCQDAGRCEVVEAHDGSEVLIAAVADGAGSAPHSEKGSRAAVDLFLATFEPLAAEDPTLACITREVMTAWFERLRDSLRADAEAEGQSLSDYACTFLGAVIGPNRAMFVQIGDGAIVVRGRDSGDYTWVFWPQNGEFANTTNFVTQDDFEHVLQVEFEDTVLLDIAMFTDGIERLVLNMAARAVHSPALRPIFEWMARADDPPSGEARGLAAFLGSERVNSRTDDDKTLVMATRAVLEPVVCPPP